MASHPMLENEFSHHRRLVRAELDELFADVPDQALFEISSAADALASKIPENSKPHKQVIKRALQCYSASLTAEFLRRQNPECGLVEFN